MRLVINGEDLEVSKAETLQELMGELRIKPERVAVEVNLAIIKKSDYDSCRLKDGDRIEIVNFVGGGQWKTSL
ncbi:MAG: sulfur carrier protein ThiS [Nitrospirota bacterium]|nr:sulfur carrier protein ThiS [Nitrospirota bacterium]